MREQKTGKDAFEQEQKRIDTDANAHRILALLVQFQKRQDSGTFVDGLIWTSEMIALHCGMSDAEVTPALEYLLKNALVERRGNQWFITTIAKEIIVAEMEYTTLRTGEIEFEFKTEAITGMDKYGNKSKLKRAALPHGGHADGSTNREENKTVERCASSENVRRIATENGCTEQDAMGHLHTGRIHRCGTCGLQRMHHKHGGKNGKQWQSACIGCRKVERWVRNLQ